MGDICIRRRKGSSIQAGSASFISSGIYDLANYGIKIGHVIDIFLVGAGGGNGGSVSRTNTGGDSRGCNGGYGGSGYTYTKLNVKLTSTIVTVTIGNKGNNGLSGSDNNPSFSGTTDGENGGNTSIVINGITYQALGGFGGKRAFSYGDEYASGGNGGSGGGFGFGWGSDGYTGGTSQGGIDGSDSPNRVKDPSNGKGQGTTTREFGEVNGTLYSTGLPRSGYTNTSNSGNTQSNGFCKIRWVKQ